MKSPYLTVAEVADIERIHIVTAFRNIRLGKIPGAKRHGRRWRINRETYAKVRGLSLEQLAA